MKIWILIEPANEPPVKLVYVNYEVAMMRWASIAHSAEKAGLEVEEKDNGLFLIAGLVRMQEYEL